MSFSYLKQLPTPEEIKQTYPLNDTCKKIKCERDEEISRVANQINFLSSSDHAPQTKKSRLWIISTAWQE